MLPLRDLTCECGLIVEWTSHSSLPVRLQHPKCGSRRLCDWVLWMESVTSLETTNSGTSGLMEQGFGLLLQDGLDFLFGVVVGGFQRAFRRARLCC